MPCGPVGFCLFYTVFDARRDRIHQSPCARISNVPADSTPGEPRVPVTFCGEPDLHIIHRGQMWRHVHHTNLGESHHQLSDLTDIQMLEKSQHHAEVRESLVHVLIWVFGCIRYTDIALPTSPAIVLHIALVSAEKHTWPWPKQIWSAAFGSWRTHLALWSIFGLQIGSNK